MILLLTSLQLISFNMSSPADTACFNLNPYAEYCGRLLDFNDTGATVELTVEVAPETWEFVDMLMMFNLDWDKRNPGNISGTKSVQISMFLDRDLYKKLKASGELVSDRAVFLAIQKDHPMKSTAVWFATEATEEVHLPEELKEKGTVREGFTTHWKQ